MPDEDVTATVETPEKETAEGEKLTVEVEEDEKIRPRLSETEAEKLTELPADDEIGRYTKDAQRRIKNLHVAASEWRRRAAQSSRDTATATSLAEQLYRENQELRQNVGKSETALIEQAVERAEAQLARARDAAKLAMTAGDADATIAANEEISRRVSEVERLKILKPEGEPAQGGAAAQGAAPARPAVSEGTRKWIAKNSWFNQPGEEEATALAMATHQKLERQGITEDDSPEQYWGAIDKRLREVYPDRFKAPEEVAVAAEPKRPVAVTGGTRTNGAPASGGNRVVRLSESQVRIAKSLGITKEQYAAQLVKEERDKGKSGVTVQ